jgi:hypothetical protein
MAGLSMTADGKPTRIAVVACLTFIPPSLVEVWWRRRERRKKERLSILPE